MGNCLQRPLVCLVTKSHILLCPSVALKPKCLVVFPIEHRLTWKYLCAYSLTRAVKGLKITSCWAKKAQVGDWKCSVQVGMCVCVKHGVSLSWNCFFSQCSYHSSSPTVTLIKSQWSCGPVVMTICPSCFIHSHLFQESSCPIVYFAVIIDHNKVCNCSVIG